MDDESALTIPGNPMLAQLAKQQSQGGGEVAQALVEKLASKETTVKAYDLDMVLKGGGPRSGRSASRPTSTLKKGMVQPLVANVIMGLVALLRDPLVRVRLLGNVLKGPSRRPSRRGSRPCRRSRPRPPRRRPRRGRRRRAEEESESEEGDDDEEEDAEEEDVDDEEEDDDEDEDEDEDHPLCVEFCLARRGYSGRFLLPELKPRSERAARRLGRWLRRRLRGPRVQS